MSICVDDQVSPVGFPCLLASTILLGKQKCTNTSPVKGQLGPFTVLAWSYSGGPTAYFWRAMNRQSCSHISVGLGPL